MLKVNEAQDGRERKKIILRRTGTRFVVSSMAAVYDTCG